MQFNELKNSVSLMFPQDRGESDDAYSFFLREALAEFSNVPGDLTGVWESIKEYDGMKRRPSFGFFIGIKNGVKVDTKSRFRYYQCECGAKLSDSSDGGCPECNKPNARETYADEPIKVISCKSSCFDCSIYSDKQIGPTCHEHGTPAYETCNMKNQCKCRTCCKFDYLRTYNPAKLRELYPEVLKQLPPPRSEVSKAFYDGRANFTNINDMLNHMRKQKEMKDDAITMDTQ